MFHGHVQATLPFFRSAIARKAPAMFSLSVFSAFLSCL